MESVEAAMRELREHPLAAIRKRFQKLEHKGVSVKAMFAEFFGTASFIFIGLTVACYVGHFQPEAGVMTNTTIVALAFGLSIGCMVYMTAHTSGGALNPAITMGFVSSGITTPVQAIANIIAQVSGGLVATILMKILVPGPILVGTHLMANVVPEGNHFISAFLAEMIGMFIVMLVILETATNEKSKAANAAPFVIGITFTVVIMAIAPISSACLNPARAFGPALLSGYLSHLWLFIAAPVCGAMLAAPVHLVSISEIDTLMERAIGDGSTAEPLLPQTVAGGNV